MTRRNNEKSRPNLPNRRQSRLNSSNNSVLSSRGRLSLNNSSSNSAPSNRDRLSLNNSSSNSVLSNRDRLSLNNSSNNSVPSNRDLLSLNNSSSNSALSNRDRLSLKNSSNNNVHSSPDRLNLNNSSNNNVLSNRDRLNLNSGKLLTPRHNARLNRQWLGSRRAAGGLRGHGKGSRLSNKTVRPTGAGTIAVGGSAAVMAGTSFQPQALASTSASDISSVSGGNR